MTKISDGIKEPWPSGMLRRAEDAIVELQENGIDGVDMDELYQVDVVLNAPLVARFSAEWGEYEYVYDGEAWKRVDE